MMVSYSLKTDSKSLETSVMVAQELLALHFLTSPFSKLNYETTGGIAATVSGFDCIPNLARENSRIISVHNCTIIKNGVAEPCRFGRYFMPGSNLYFACWACMLSSVAISLRWKAAKALKFVQSKAEREQQQQALQQVGGEDYSDDDDDNDDDNTR